MESRHQRPGVSEFLAIVAIWWVVGSSDARAFAFEEIVDADTPLVNQTGTFEDLGPPAFDDGDLAFVHRVAAGSGPAFGVFTFIDGVLRQVSFDGSTSRRNPSNPSLSQGRVAFSLGNSAGASPLMTDLTGTLQSFGLDRRFSLSRGQLAFADTPPDVVSLYDGNSVHDLVSPSRGVLFSSLSLDGQDIAYTAHSSSNKMVRKKVLNRDTIVASLNTTIPGDTTSFTNLSSPSLSSGSVAFLGIGDQRMGIYSDWTGSLSVVADSETSVPDNITVTPSTFDEFGSPSLDGDQVAFWATSDDRQGIYLASLDGPILKVVDTNDSLGGKAITALEFWKEGLNGDGLAFVATFADGTEGIYVASIPEPTTFVLLMLGLVGLVDGRRPISAR